MHFGLPRFRARAGFKTLLACTIFLSASGALGVRGRPGVAPSRSFAKPAGAARVTSSLSTFVVFYSPVIADYNTAQFKLTYLGGQEKIKTSLTGVSIGRPGGFDLAPFHPFEHHGDYSNDSHIGATMAVSPGELKAFLDGILARPSMQDTTQPALPEVSLMVMRGLGGGTLCWEHLTPTKPQGDSLFQLLHDAVLSPGDKATVDEFRHHMVGVRQ